MRFIAVAFILSIAALPALAADAQGRFAVRNAGMMSCADFVKEKVPQTPKLGQYLGWLDGYLSAVNQYTPQTYDVIPWGNTLFLATLLENYCKKHPEERFYLAVNKLAASMLPQRLSEASELIRAKYKGNETFIYQATLARVQTYLQDKGYYKGKPDGQWNDNTRQALETYQKKRKLTVTGLPDQLTLYLIFKDLAGQ